MHERSRSVSRSNIDPLNPFLRSILHRGASFGPMCGQMPCGIAAHCSDTFRLCHSTLFMHVHGVEVHLGALWTYGTWREVEHDCCGPWCALWCLGGLCVVKSWQAEQACSMNASKFAPFFVCITTRLCFRSIAVLRSFFSFFSKKSTHNKISFLSCSATSSCLFAVLLCPLEC